MTMKHFIKTAVNFDVQGEISRGKGKRKIRKSIFQYFTYYILKHVFCIRKPVIRKHA